MPLNMRALLRLSRFWRTVQTTTLVLLIGKSFGAVSVNFPATFVAGLSFSFVFKGFYMVYLV